MPEQTVKYQDAKGHWYFKATLGTDPLAGTLKLAGALKLAVSSGDLIATPMAAVPRPVKTQKVPAHWSPEESRAFLGGSKG